MKQSGAVAAYQIIQTPPAPTPGLIQLRQAAKTVAQFYGRGRQENVKKRW